MKIISLNSDLSSFLICFFHFWKLGESISFTGGEPLVHPLVVEIVRRIASIPNIEEVSLTTNALLLERVAQPLVDAGFERVNISLDSSDADKFRLIIPGGGINRIWREIAAAERAHLAPTKLNTVIVCGLNTDELPVLSRLTIENPWPCNSSKSCRSVTRRTAAKVFPRRANDMFLFKK
jgi:molybdenum cofactor biosynthesis enzyme MoaA